MDLEPELTNRVKFTQATTGMTVWGCEELLAATVVVALHGAGRSAGDLNHRQNASSSL
jgi:hypothetical protein